MSVRDFIEAAKLLYESDCEEFNRATENAYGCVKCQTYHYEHEPIFQQHIYAQSKHGINPRPLRYANRAAEEEKKGAQ